MEESVSRAMLHMYTFIHPHVYVSDELHREEATFANPLRARVRQVQRTLIELPDRGASAMMWMARLDSNSLSGFVSPTSTLCG